MNRARLVCAAGVLAAWFVGAARAQTPDAPVAQPSEVVSTASAKDAPKDTTAAQIADWIKGPPLGRVSDDDSDGVITGEPNRGVHGEGGVFVSNFGYGGYVAATMPVGKDATLGLAVRDTQFNGRYLHGSARSLAASLAWARLELALSYRLCPCSSMPRGHSPGAPSREERQGRPEWESRHE